MSRIILTELYATSRGEIMLTVPLMSEHADQCLPEDTLTRAAVVRINLTPFLSRAALLTLDQSDTQVARSSHICLCPPFSSVLVHSSISLQSQIIFQRNSEPPGTSKCQKCVKTKSHFFSLSFQKTGEGSRHWLKLACTGTRWPTLARKWCRLSGCQVIEDCQSNFK